MYRGRCLATDDIGREILEEPAVFAKENVLMRSPVECPPEIAVVVDAFLRENVEIVSIEETHLLVLAHPDFRMLVQQGCQVSGSRISGHR